MAYDMIIIGLGAMGSATLYQAAKRGAKVLGIDRLLYATLRLKALAWFD